MRISVAFSVLIGCTAVDPYATNSLPKGERLDIQNILAAHPNKKACVDYEAATNSCASIITATVDGNTMIAREVAAVKIPGTDSTQRIEILTQSNLRGGQACVRPNDVTVEGRDTASAFALSVTRQLIADFGGSVCATYYRSGHGYIVSSVGANGQSFPPGDTHFQFILGQASLRAH